MDENQNGEQNTEELNQLPPENQLPPGDNDLKDSEQPKEKKEDIDKILKILDLSSDTAKIFKLAYSDGKIDWKDGLYGLQLAKKIPSYVSAWKNAGETVREAKDIDMEELAQIGAKVIELIKNFKD